MSSKISLAEISAVFPPYGGGIGMVAYENARMLSSHADVTVFTPASTKGSNALPNEHFSVERLRPLCAYGNAAFLPQLVWRLRGYDVLHLHYPFIESVFATLLAKWLWKKKLIVTYHMDLIGTRQPFRFVFWMYNRYIAPFLIARASSVIVTSKDYAESSAIGALVRKNPEAFVEIPNSVDTKRFYPQPKPDWLLERYGIAHDETVFLFVGGMDGAHYFKGVDVLLEAFSQVREQTQRGRLVLVGEGDLRKQYEGIAKDQGIEKWVTFAGSLKKEKTDELPYHYALADCVILPSVERSEAFGVVLIEAGASEKPVIASNLPGVRSVVVEGVTGFLATPRDSRDLACKMIFFLQKGNEARNMGIKARKRVEEQYSNSAVESKLRNVFQL